MNKEQLRLYVITDGMRNPEIKVEQAIEGGATIVQYREKSLGAEEKYEEAMKLFEVCREYGVPLIINDDVELAEKIGADGVHVGQSDMSVWEARKRLGKNAIIGATAKTIPQAIEAMNQGADYLGSGAMYVSSTKLDATPMSVECLKSICESVSIPVVAIGGITKNNMDPLIGTGIAGVAVINGVFGEKDVTLAAKEIYEKTIKITGGI